MFLPRTSDDLFRLGFYIFLCVVWCGGCGGKTYQTVPVSGRVTLDGRPLAGAHVSFQPVAVGNSNPGPGSFGITDADGRFQLQTIGQRRNGAVVGQHIVRIAMQQPTAAVDNDEVPKRDNSLPLQADDGSLRFDVPDNGTDAANITLSTRQ